MTSIWQMTLELVVGFFALLVLTKILGKTQLSQATPFDFISALVLGELVGNAIFDPKVKFYSILYAVFFWGLLIFVIEMISLKFRRSRNILDGDPSIVVRNGVIDRQELKKNKIDVNQLMNLIRQKDVFSIREIAYAILEPNGSISLLKQSNYDTPTKSELNIPPRPPSLPVALITDGEIIKRNLSVSGLDENTLYEELRKQNIYSAKDVFYAEHRQEDGLYVQQK